MLKYRQTGDDAADLVVLLHAGGTSGWMWNKVQALLPDLTCAAVDLPGHGLSRDVEWHSLRATATDVWSLVEQDFPDRDFHLIGISLGAYVGLEMLSARPKLAKTAVLSGLHAGGMKYHRAMKLMAQVTGRLGSVGFLARKNARMFGVTSEDELSAYARQAALVKSRAAIQSTVDVIDYQAPDTLGAIEAGVVLCGGEKEHPLILDSLGRLSKSIPDSVSAVAPGLGHGWVSQDSSLFAQLVRGRVKGQPIPQELRRLD